MSTNDINYYKFLVDSFVCKIYNEMEKILGRWKLYTKPFISNG